jgi:hypothetical protein
MNNGRSGSNGSTKNICYVLGIKNTLKDCDGDERINNLHICKS